MAKSLALCPEPGLLEETKEELGKFNLVRFIFSDLSGVSRSLVVPVHTARDVLQGGLACYSGMLSLGANSSLVFPPEVLQKGFNNVHVIPDLSTLHPAPWIDDGTFKTADILAETHWIDDVMSPQTAGPRYVARTQLARLDQLGYRLFSGTELEFNVFEMGTLKPVFEGHQFLSSLLHSKFMPFFAEVNEALGHAKVEVLKMHTEFSPGQFEIVTTPKYGIEAADAAFTLKQVIKEICYKRNWTVNFMSKSMLKEFGNGWHYNFSVWEKTSPKNAFWDESEENGLSEFARHWLAGMMKHACALTALCCSSTNCYSRLVNNPLVSHVADWGYDNRGTMIRVKSEGPVATYMENRLPSALCSPYLVTAGTIAAGLDGVINKLECPKPKDTENSPPLPNSLQEALKSLREDKVIVEALGSEFVDWFVQVKQDVDLKVIDGLDDPEEILAREYEEYALLA